MPAAALPTPGSVLRGAITSKRGTVGIAALLIAGHQGFEALVPVVIGRTIDEAVATGSATALLRWIAILAVLFAALSSCYRFGARFAERAAETAAHDLRVRVSERVLDSRGGAAKGRLAGELANIATSDAKRVGAVNLILPFGLAGLAGLLVSAVSLLQMSVPLGLLVLLGTPPLLVLAHFIGRPLERRSDVEQERAAYASGVAADLVSGLRVLKGIGAEPRAVARYRRTSRDSLKATLRAARAKSWHDGAILALTGVFIALVALVGGRLAASGDISVGDLVAAVGLAQFLLTPFQIFGRVNAGVAQARASAGRVAGVLAAPPAVPGGDGKLPSEVPGSIRISGLSHENLRELSLEVSPGELVGVVAPDPAVARDLLGALGREFDPASGTVAIDGTSLSTVDPDEVRRAILVAAHDADLFEGSLLDNVRAGGPAVERAMAAANADEVAATLPDGAETILTERGRSLSGGQRQRVALARALAADPPVLLVHDPTTAVDAVTEAKIAGKIAEVRRGRTTIVVTTSPALLAVTDRVVVLDGGTVSAHGRHPDLVRDNASYRAAVLS
ncbi:ABC transporter ATP-binding protein [Amycolatopsis sp. CA-230715]|uniref:ABC transporter ATP-binding protein n=1 Tax=Amycolatopsis sp. CA-230715 TaxID=2745196 RepID=UPI001C032E68|nr:ABC transporter ATP-binding protein [Amycolatopsis sp. CA-230715]QWF79745.1 putative multidrug resistance ABC transporter ATP-binding/permease protein YheI [Amycolatopsis sp. CA-230715]